MVTGAYKPRNPKASALYQCVQKHFTAFEGAYPTRYQEQYGFYRPVIGRAVEKFLGCGDLTKGFARVRCDTCRHEYLLAFVLEHSGNPAESGTKGGTSAPPVTRSACFSSEAGWPKRSWLPSLIGSTSSPSPKCSGCTSGRIAGSSGS